MRIGIDADGVLRDLIGHLAHHITDNHPEYANQISTPTSWDWVDWLPFWTEDETEKYVFEDNYIDLFGIDCPPIKSSVEDWPIIKKWAKDNDHELVLVSAQRKQTRELTDIWLEHYNFDFKEKYYTNKKHLVNVDILIDDSPEKIKKFKNQSIMNGVPIVYKQPWNTKTQINRISINRLREITSLVFG